MTSAPLTRGRGSPSSPGRDSVRAVALAIVVGAAGCGRVGFDPVEPPECTAQRTVYIVGAPGSLAWFTLVWPLPAVITGFQAGYAYDDPSLAMAVVATAEHPLYARHGLWAEVPRAQPSAILAGFNETHTSAPITMVQVGGKFVIAAGVEAQHALAAPLPALGFTPPTSYVPDLPLAADVDAAVAALRTVTTVSAATEAALRPDPVTLASWYGASPSVTNARLAERLLFTANAFRAGLIGTVLIQVADDPHGAFIDGIATPSADQLVGILHGFEVELAGATEPACRVDGAPVALADNVVVVVLGDTPKDSFTAFGWPDGTPGNSNWMYVRSNGYLRPGWFGSITNDVAGRIGFDPATGMLSDAATQADDAAAADRALLYAITRGDTAAVDAFAPGPYQGLVVPP